MKQLENIKVPTVEMNSFQSKLGENLMSSKHWNKKNNFLAGFAKRILIAGVSLCIIAVAVVSYNQFSDNPLAPTQVSAQELARRSYEKLSDLPEAKQQGILQMLKEAQDAPDLKMLTYEEYATKYPKFVPAATGLTDKLDEYKTGKFLEYTNPRGEKVVLGINQNDLPFLNLLPEKENYLSPEEQKEMEKKLKPYLNK